MKEVKHAQNEEAVNRIIQLRYTVLREPWQQPIDTASDALEMTATNAYIEDEQGLVVACGRLQVNDAQTGQVRFMAVSPEVQGQGLGRKIMIDLEEKARQLGLQRIELQARENAVDFYESMGYTIREKSFLLWGIIQHYLMEKEI